MKKVVTFGEIMLRLMPPDHLRFVQARSFDATYAGAEANVAVGLANLGVPADFVTCLSSNDLGDACLNFIRQYGVGTEKIIRTDGRLGIYFVEKGAVQRGNKVIYDREDSAFAKIEPGMFDWNKIFSDACWFHWTGITPALSEGTAEATLMAVNKAKELGLTVSCDLNYRSKLWKWGRTPEEVMSELVPNVDELIGNEEDAGNVFGIKAPGVDVEKGEVKAFREDIFSWTEVGAAVLNMGTSLILKDLVKAEDVDGIRERVGKCIQWIDEAGTRSATLQCSVPCAIGYQAW